MIGHLVKAYLIAAETVHDERMFSEYRKQVMATLSPYGASFLARGGTLTVLEGKCEHKRLVIIEFPSREAVEAWYKSDDYQRIVGLRQRSTSGDLLILDGI
jgi:uncharacterized protein (DUF1330 family)